MKATVIVKIGDVEVSRATSAIDGPDVATIVVDVDPHKAASAVGKTFKRSQYRSTTGGGPVKP